MDPSLYEEHALLERDHWWFVGRREIISALLEHWLPAQQGRHILDVGCGTGGMLPLLARFGEVRGIEPEPMAIELCHRRFPEFAVRQGAIPADLPVDSSGDLVTAFDVIEHIEDDRAAVRGLRATVRPGGMIAITVPAFRWLWSDHDVVNHHFRRYTLPGLVEVIEGAGLRVLHASYFNSLLLPFVAASRLSQRVRRERAEPGSDFSMPSPTVNRVLTKVMSQEARWIATRRVPFGVSLLVIASRPH